MSMCLSPFVYLSDGMAGYGELGKVWEARRSWVQIQNSGLLASVSLSLSCDLSGPFASLCELWWMVTGVNACLAVFTLTHCGQLKTAPPGGVCTLSPGNL